MARRRRSNGWGARHPRFALSLMTVVMAILICVGVADLAAGSYQGPAWWLCAAAGIAVAAGGAFWLTAGGARRAGRLGRPARAVLWLLGVGAVISIRSGFPHGRYAGAGEFLNLLRAALVGYGIVYCLLIGYTLLRAIPRALPRPPVTLGKAGPGSVQMKVKLRFPGADPAGRQGAAAWRRGRLTAVNGTALWEPSQGGAPVDLTGATLAPDRPPSGPGGSRPRATTLMTAQGPVELAAVPAAIGELFPSGPGTGPL